MNRMILFRGYNYQYQKWFYGSLVTQNYEGNFLLSDTKTIIVDDRLNQVVVDRGTIGQYTGLKDKNNVPIYEGDIIRATEYLNPGEVELEYQVKYVDEMCKFVFYPLLRNGKYDNNNWNLDVRYYKKENIEVIGNIYDNEVEE